MDNPLNKLEFERSNNRENYAALSRKLVTDRREPNERKKKKDQRASLDKERVDTSSRKIATDRADADAILQMLPDIELVKEIIIGSILSPKDLYSATVNLTAQEGDFSSEILRPCLQIAERNVKDVYKIDDKLESILEKALFSQGSCPILVLPENNLDELINGSITSSNEHFTDLQVRHEETTHLGILGDPDTDKERRYRYSVENYGSRKAKDKLVSSTGPINTVSVSDNYNVLKSDQWRRRARKAALSSILSADRKRNVSMEGKGLTEQQIDELYSRNTNQQPKASDGVTLTPQAYAHRRSKGWPLCLTLPPESVIPVFQPGSPENHVGYFLLLDENNMPLHLGNDRDYYQEINDSYNQAATRSSAGAEYSQNIQQVRDAVNGTMGDRAANGASYAQAFSQIVEHDLLSRLRNGLYDEELTFDFSQNVSAVMLWRSLRNQQTKVLFIPEELMVYIAFEHDSDGTGLSMLAKTKIISSLRMSMALAYHSGQLRNAIPRKRVSITPDPDDEDPIKTLGDVTTLLVDQQRLSQPFGVNNPDMLVDAMIRSGLDVSIQGDNDGLEKTKIEFEDYASQNQGGMNTDYQDYLRRSHTAAFQVTPELVDPQASPDFAVSVVNNNLMMARMVLRRQKTLTRHLTKFVRLFCMHSSVIRDEMREELTLHNEQFTEEQRGLQVDQVIDEIIELMSVTLPSPDMSRTEQQLDALEKYEALLDKGIEAYVSSDLIPDDLINGEHGGDINTAITAIRSKFIRDWMSRENVLPELDVLLEMEDDDKPAFSLIKAQEPILKSLGKSLKDFLMAYLPQTDGGTDVTSGSDDYSGDDGDYSDGESDEPQDETLGDDLDDGSSTSEDESADEGEADESGNDGEAETEDADDQEASDDADGELDDESEDEATDDDSEDDNSEDSTSKS